MDDDDDSGLAALQAELAAAGGEDDAAWLELAMQVALAAVAEYDDDVADATLAAIDARVAHDVALAIATKRELGRRFEREYESVHARTQLRDAFALATGDDRIAIGVELATALRFDDDAAARALLAELLPLALASATRDIAARIHLALGVYEAAEHHARAARDLVATSTDTQLRRDADRMLAEALIDRAIGRTPELSRAAASRFCTAPDRGLLLEAEAIAAATPPSEPTDDSHAGRERNSSSLLEDIRRRLGLLPADPPAHELEPPPVPADLDPSSWLSSLYVPATTISDELRACFTPPADDLAAYLAAHRLVSGDKIREWSHGAIATEADLDSEKIFGPMRSYYCACGRYRGNRYHGMVCEHCGVEVVHRGIRAARAGHITLRTPVMHPWLVPAIAVLLDTAPAALRATPAAELRERLDALYLIEIAVRAQHDLEFARSDKQRRTLAAKQAIAEALTAQHSQPRDFVLELVPVLPPEVDWPGVDRDALRTAYRRIVGGDEPPRAVGALFRCFE